MNGLNTVNGQQIVRNAKDKDSAMVQQIKARCMKGHFSCEGHMTTSAREINKMFSSQQWRVNKMANKSTSLTANYRHDAIVNLWYDHFWARGSPRKTHWRLKDRSPENHSYNQRLMNAQCEDDVNCRRGHWHFYYKQWNLIKGLPKEHGTASVCVGNQSACIFIN